MREAFRSIRDCLATTSAEPPIVSGLADSISFFSGPADSVATEGIDILSKSRSSKDSAGADVSSSSIRKLSMSLGFAVFDRFLRPDSGLLGSDLIFKVSFFVLVSEYPKTRNEKTINTSAI